LLVIIITMLIVVGIVLDIIAALVAASRSNLLKLICSTPLFTQISSQGVLSIPERDPGDWFTVEFFGFNEQRIFIHLPNPDKIHKSVCRYGNSTLIRAGACIMKGGIERCV
jgi:hypothetical protein